MPDPVTLSPIILSTPSRLHFGLFSVGTAVERQFGGVGLMVQSPRTTIRVSPSKKLQITIGAQVDDPSISVTVRKIIEHWLRHFYPIVETALEFDLKTIDQLPIAIEIQEIAPRHRGLGSGTQLALCVATATMKFFGLGVPNPIEMAVSTGRGKRSAIGSFGFFEGGMLVDRGKADGELVAPLDFRTDFPEHWPILIVHQNCADKTIGLSGSSEIDAFKNLPPVSIEQRQAMVAIVRDQLIPGVLQNDYDQFGAAIFDFGRASGSFFETVQGGSYNGRAVTELVKFLRDQGVTAVGQSSWGPCVFAIARHDKMADEVTAKLNDQFGTGLEIIRTIADNRGAISIPAATVDQI